MQKIRKYVRVGFCTLMMVCTLLTIKMASREAYYCVATLSGDEIIYTDLEN